MVIENIYTIFNFNFFKLITTLIPTLILTIMALMELLWAEKIITSLKLKRICISFTANITDR